MRGGAVALALVAATLAWASSALAAGLPGPRREILAAPPLDAPYHGSLEGLAFGGSGELRFGEDREAGISNPDWFSFGWVNGFILARVSPRIDLAMQGSWDRVADDFTLERAEAGLRLGRATLAHAGVFLAPLGRTNLSHDAPSYDFAERSLVATQIVGVPHAQLGVGVRKLPPAEGVSRMYWEADVVTGYDDGIVTRSPGGTRIPSGRNNYGDKNGIPAVVGRVAIRSAGGRELGLAAQSGPYNSTSVDGVHVDRYRWVHVVVADASTDWAGFRIFTEGAYALIDVPPTLEALYAEQQAGVSLEMVRTLFDPLFRGWRGSSVTAGLRADLVDFDRSVQGDSRSRLSASVNLYHRPTAVTRLGWYYEIRRDRFNNSTPLAGLTFTAATYF